MISAYKCLSNNVKGGGGGGGEFYRWGGGKKKKKKEGEERGGGGGGGGCGNLDVNGRIQITCIFKKQGLKVWDGLTVSQDKVQQWAFANTVRNPQGKGRLGILMTY